MSVHCASMLSDSTLCVFQCRAEHSVCVGVCVCTLDRATAAVDSGSKENQTVMVRVQTNAVIQI